ncbi:MAG: flagellar hook assembly protein FlgD [Deltaproteobacteria bacterium]|nr:flagellar hook assembly protein FlgD [Deltaproteobacteria bacterium]
MVDSISTVSGASSASEVMKKTLGMNKDDFLTLFVTQLKNQDPLKPMDGTEFLAQLAQLTQVEQAYNANSNLAGIIDSLNASSALSAVSFIGKEVTATGSEVSLTSGEDAKISYATPFATEQLTVAIKDAKGNVVRTLSQAQGTAGEGSIVWDGKDANGNQLPSGIYTADVSGVQTDGSVFSCDTLIKGKVDGVSYAGSLPVLTVGGVEVKFSSILRVKEVA